MKKGGGKKGEGERGRGGKKEKGRGGGGVREMEREPLL